MTERILKNIGSGVLAQAWSGALGLVVLPILVRGLGPERYGLLALSLGFIGFAAVADLGVGRAASKYLAEDYENNTTCRTQTHLSNALTIATVMGTIGTGALMLSTPFLVNHILRIPPFLVGEARAVLWVTSLGLTPVLLRISLDGALAGHHRILELSIGTLIANTLKAGLSVAAVLGGYSIIGVVAVNVSVSFLHATGLWLYARSYFAGRVRMAFGWDRRVAQELVRLGLFASSASLLAGILLLYFGRFVIAAFLPLAALGYYSTAFDITSKQCYISSPIGQAFFPVFSGKSTVSLEALQRHYLRATRLLAATLTGVAFLLMALAHPLLACWISPEFAANGAGVMSVLAMAMLFSSYATVPYLVILGGSPAPQVCSKIFALAFLLHAMSSLLLVRFLGTVGVALALLLAFLFAFCAASWWVGAKLLPGAGIGFILRHGLFAPWLTGTAVGFIWWSMVAPRLHSLLGVGTALVAGYVIYLAVCGTLVCSREEFAYGWNLARRLFPLSSRSSPLVSQ